MKYNALAVAIALISGTAVAQGHNSESDELEEVVVKAHPLHEKGLSQSIEVLKGDELSDALQSSLGATLAAQPGIRSAKTITRSKISSPRSNSTAEMIQHFTSWLKRVLIWAKIDWHFATFVEPSKVRRAMFATTACTLTFCKGSASMTG